MTSSPTCICFDTKRFKFFPLYADFRVKNIIEITGIAQIHFIRFKRQSGLVQAAQGGQQVSTADHQADDSAEDALEFADSF